MTRGPLTIVDLMRGRFAPLFPNETWRGWIVVAAVIFGLSHGLSQEDQALALALLGRRTLPREPAREFWAVVGRRGGKSRFVAWLAVFLAAFRDYRGILSPGERGIGMIITPDRRQARVAFRYVAAILEGDPMLAALVESQTREAIHLRNGISIEVHTASFRTLRGYTVVFAIVDEAAYLPTDDSAEPDTELLAALRPAMATVPGALLMVISSPYARRGELWRAYKEHFGRSDDPVVVIQAETRAMNPTVDPRVIEQAYLDDEAVASAEYGAQFRRDLEAFISREVLDAATMPGLHERPPVPGVRYTAFVDPSGGGADSMTLAIAHQERDRSVLDCLREARPPFSPEAVIAEFVGALQSYRIAMVVGDRFGGEFAREPFRKAGIEYRLSAAAKSDLYRDVLPLINSGRVELLDHRRLVAQFTGLERRTSRGGRDSIDHAPGAHDDVCNAAAGALLAAMRADQGMSRELIRFCLTAGAGEVDPLYAGHSSRSDYPRKEPNEEDQSPPHRLTESSSLWTIDH
jgi:hypothetical protein